MFIFWGSILFWTLSSILGFLSLSAYANIMNENALPSNVGILSNNLPVTLIIYIFWAIYIYNFIKFSKTKQKITMKNLRDVSFQVTLFYFFFDILIWGILASFVGFFYFTTVSTWLGYILIYILMSKIGSKVISHKN